MKIGIVLSKTPNYSETFFLSKIKGLKASGFEVTLFVQKKTADFILCDVKTAPKVYKKNIFFQGINTLVVLAGLLFRPKRLQEFIQLEKRANRSAKQILKNIYNNSHLLKADLDWLHFGFATMALQSEHVAKAIGAKMAVSFRGFDIDVYPLQHPKCYTLLWENVSKVHTISNYLLEKAYTLGLSKQVPFQVITPAVDVSKFISTVQKHSEIIHFLTIARLHWIKGINYTLEALAVLKRKGIKFNYTILGDGSEYENIAFAIHQLQLNDEVKLVGKKPHNEIIAYLSTTDIYIQYSESEGFCNAVLEAQAMGLLCVVSDGGALPENVLHEKTGWVVTKRNPVALSKALEYVINLSQDEKNYIEQNARQRAIKEFNLDKQQQEFIEFYK